MEARIADTDWFEIVIFDKGHLVAAALGTKYLAAVPAVVLGVSLDRPCA